MSDTGCGIEESIADRIFDPFFTTKGDNGTGLGLSVCQGIIHQHNGTLSFHPRSNAGASFEIALPRSEPPFAIEADSEVQDTLQPLNGTARVLLVEDEPDVRHLTTRLLQEFGKLNGVAIAGLQNIETLKASAFESTFFAHVPQLCTWPCFALASKR